jgi:hypothetical protein
VVGRSDNVLSNTKTSQQGNVMPHRCLHSHHFKVFRRINVCFHYLMTLSALDLHYCLFTLFYPFKWMCHLKRGGNSSCAGTSFFQKVENIYKIKNVFCPFNEIIFKICTKKVLLFSEVIVGKTI